MTWNSNLATSKLQRYNAFKEAMIDTLIALAIGCGFIACQGPNPTPAGGIDLSLMDKEVRPQDDFYNFVND